MTAPHLGNLTIDELAASAAVLLSEAGLGQPSGRVREVPDARTLRFYTTHGLLDRPAAFQGRTALYGRRHLHQIVAIKRLQARGLSLAGIQERLLGLDDRALARLAGAEPADEKAAVAQSAAPRRRSTFWKTPPSGTSGDRAEPQPVIGPPPGVREERLGAIRLGDGLVLLVERASREIDDTDREAARAAAAPLVKALRVRRLLDASTDGSGAT
jgi:DNA-binding transcriptional MerR regulator